MIRLSEPAARALRTRAALLTAARGHRVTLSAALLDALIRTEAK